ncbi:MAG: HK97 gp10 family phage protein [Methanolobus sp.]|uniref:HK97-gp10 family putative phage morphogenesis protein n=1 Tax=Methanolobus sp. TaxID=1874737 RepID=UPI00273195CE|nr:HK97-gp10 family putative phage morphogenesis protein [Methanolobus sp.]MDP2216742.1 HK97 gp10 family phage protein [Methanolobus sp.]
MFKMTVSGVEELQKKLETIGKDISDVLEETTAAGAMVVVRAAQDNSRKGGEFPHRITGNLFRNIAEVSPAVVKKTNERCEMAVGSSMEYARRLEHGFMDTDKLGRRYNQQPKPFLRPALDDNTDEIEQAIAKKLEQVVRRHS